jgi:DNA mismatch repair ATPase MutS
MKAFLMFKDRDFDAEQSPPANAQDLIQDLELNTLFNAMARGDKFLNAIAKESILNSLKDVETIRYRQEILKDCLKYPDIVRSIYELPIEALKRKQRSWLGIFTHSPGGVLSSAVEMMSMLVELLRILRNISDENSEKFQSDGFARFFQMIKEELDDQYLSLIDNHLHQLKFRNGVLISAAIGKGNQGENYTLRLPDAKESWIKEVISKKTPSYSFFIAERDDAGARTLGEIKGMGINSAANALAQATEHVEYFFGMLRRELAFYIGCINLKEQVDELNHKFAFPTPLNSSERQHKFSGLYDICLALTIKKEISGNSLNADNKNIMIITGANQGGKSTFLRSIGLSQLMMQAGMFVTAEEFCANISNGVFTHYRRKEDASMKSGKLDEELTRMSALIDLIGPDTLVMFNESFASTNEREGSEIARQIATALLDRDVKIFFVTHMYEFASKMFQKVNEGALFLRAERKSGGRRTFKLVEGGPLRSSFGQDVYKSIFGFSK